MKLVTAALCVTFAFAATQVHAGGDDACFPSCESECLNDGHTSKSVCKRECTAECGGAPRDIPPAPVCTLQHNPAYDACLGNDYAWLAFCLGSGVIPYCYSAFLSAANQCPTSEITVCQ